MARPDDDPVELAGRLWDLAGWRRRGRELLAPTDAEPGDLLAGDSTHARSIEALIRDLPREAAAG